MLLSSISAVHLVPSAEHSSSSLFLAVFLTIIGHNDIFMLLCSLRLSLYVFNHSFEVLFLNWSLSYSIPEPHSPGFLVLCHCFYSFSSLQNNLAWFVWNILLWTYCSALASYHVSLTGVDTTLCFSSSITVFSALSICQLFV